MVLIYSLIFAMALSLFLTSSIKKHAWVYYLLASFVAIATIGSQFGLMIFGIQIQGIVGELLKISLKGIISVAFFILVMVPGALSRKWGITKRLLRIRAELAIIASILILPHGIMYLVYFVMGLLEGGPLSIVYLSFSIAGIIALVIMMPLFITSFKNIRIEIQGGKWKMVQKWAYVFYILTYLHVIIILVARDNVDIIKVATYSIIFGLYGVAKIAKFICSKRKAKNNVEYEIENTNCM
ncbi:MAG: ferric reductase-like transmembrane domain-containing protein [Clostridium sp.]